MFWVSPLHVWSPHPWAPTPLPSPDRSSSCPHELCKRPGMGSCTWRQMQTGAHTALALSRLKPGTFRLISHGLQEHTGRQNVEPHSRGITFSSLCATAAASGTCPGVVIASSVSVNSNVEGKSRPRTSVKEKNQIPQGGL